MKWCKYLLEITDIYQMHKDRFETEDLWLKVLLIAGNELNKEKWTYEDAIILLISFLFPNSIFSLCGTGYLIFWQWNLMNSM